MKKLFYLIIVINLVCAGSALAQGSSFSIQYAVGSPTGFTRDHISTVSFRGILFEYKRFIHPGLSLGIDAGWNVFYERRAFDTYTVGTLSYSGTQYRYGYAVPIFATVNHYFKPGEYMNPFVGLGIGTLYYDKETDMGVYVSRIDAWHFALRPEVGVLFNANPDLDFVVSLKYMYGFENSQATNATYMTFNIGLVFK